MSISWPREKGTGWSGRGDRCTWDNGWGMAKPRSWTARGGCWPGRPGHSSCCRPPEPSSTGSGLVVHIQVLERRRHLADDALELHELHQVPRDPELPAHVGGHTGE